MRFLLTTSYTQLILIVLSRFSSNSNRKLSPFILLFILNHFQVYLTLSRTCKWNIHNIIYYVFSITFKNR